jgi:6-phosphogluconolactonase
MKPDIYFHYSSNNEESSQQAAQVIVEGCRRSIEEKNLFTLVLSGGRTPARLYELLSSPPLAGKIPWGMVHIFWSDERYLPPTHEESNFFLAQDFLLRKIEIPRGNIHRIPTDGGSPAEDAARYQDEIMRFFAQEAKTAPAVIPRFDLILLGLGTDGHTASLFPGSPLLTEGKLLVAAVSEPAGIPPVPRITFTFPLLNQGKRVVFLAGGREKLSLIEKIQEGLQTGKPFYPAAMVVPEGRLDWFISSR